MYLWPRQEVFQVVIPQIANGTKTKPLTFDLALTAAKKLAQSQSPEGLISFDKWLIVAKECFRWNDNIISLFWQTLQLAVWYHKYDDKNPIFSENADIELDYISIFLVLHIVDAPNSITSARSNYDSIWPSNVLDRDEGGMSSPNSSSQRPSTPVRTQMTSPLSPHSPKSAPSASPSSPSRPVNVASPTTAHGTPHQNRSSAQHLYSLKQKLPQFLKIISIDEVLSVPTQSPPHNLDNMMDTTQVSSPSLSISILPTKTTQEFLISAYNFDHLSMIIAGGTNRSTESTDKLSNLCPYWTKISSNNEGSAMSTNMTDSTNRLPDKESVTYSMVLEWLEDFLVINDTIYPNTTSSNTASKYAQVILGGEVIYTYPDARGKVGGGGSGAISPRSALNLSPRNYDDVSVHINMSPRGLCIDKTQQVHVPLQCTLSMNQHQMMSLLTSVRNYNSTLLYTLSNTQTSNDGDAVDNFNTVAHTSINNVTFGSSNNNNNNNTEMKVSPRLFPYFHPDSDNYEDSTDNNTTVSSLPNACINGSINAHIYLLAPYKSVTICNITDSTIIIGAVAGAIIISNCERVNISVCCRKLIILGSIECNINMASLSPTIIGSDCRGLSFGPLNMTYKSHGQHLVRTQLSGLINQHTYSAKSDTRGSLPNIHVTNTTTTITPTNTYDTESMYPMINNQWNILYEISSCQESTFSANSPIGYAIDAAASLPTHSIIPSVPSHIATIQLSDKFTLLSIPIPHEQDTMINGPIMLPPSYQAKLYESKTKLQYLQTQLSSISTYYQNHKNMTTGSASSSTKTVDIPPPLPDITTNSSTSSSSSNNNNSSSTIFKSTNLIEIGTKEGHSVPVNMMHELNITDLHVSTSNTTNTNMNTSGSTSGNTFQNLTELDVSSISMSAIAPPKSPTSSAASSVDKHTSHTRYYSTTNTNTSSLALAKDALNATPGTGFSLLTPSSNSSPNVSPSRSICEVEGYDTIKTDYLPPKFNKAFMEWLISTGKMQELIDLVKLESGTNRVKSNDDGYQISPSQMTMNSKSIFELRNISSSNSTTTNMSNLFNTNATSGNTAISLLSSSLTSSLDMNTGTTSTSTNIAASLKKATYNEKGNLLPRTLDLDNIK